MVNRLLANIRNRIVNWALWLSFKRGKVSELSLRHCWDGVKSCMVCWPGEGLDITAADIILSRLRERFPQAVLTILAMPGVGASPPPGLNIHIVQVDRKSINFLGLPLRRLKDEVLDIRADVAVDLSSEYNPLSAYLCQISRARISVAFADPQGDLAYNYQFAPHPSREGLDRYRALARYIG